MDNKRPTPEADSQFRIKPAVETKMSTQDGAAGKVVFSETEKLKIQSEAQKASNGRAGKTGDVRFPGPRR